MIHTVVIADVHLDSLNAELDHFLDFLSTLQKSNIRTLYILGDLFTIWLGTPKMLLEYQRPVIEALQRLRDKSVLVKYVEGNRDYFLSPLYLDTPFVLIASEYAQEVIGNKQIYFSHGDLVNVDDKRYRLWRKISRNRMIYAGFKRLPQAVAGRFVHYLEQAFRRTNQKNKSFFPAKTCEIYARNLFQAGYNVIILGHFHEEHSQEFSINGQKTYLYVLPAWKDTHKYLQISDLGECSFRKF
jgi:UDP-2,3-diacylglucosamine hydrolase